MAEEKKSSRLSRGGQIGSKMAQQVPPWLLLSAERSVRGHGELTEPPSAVGEVGVFGTPPPPQPPSSSFFPFDKPVLFARWSWL